MHRALLFIGIIFVYSCSSSTEKSDDYQFDEWESETVFKHKNELSLVKKNKEKDRKYVLVINNNNKEIELLHDRNSDLINPFVKQIQWQGKGYQDWVFQYQVKGSFSFGKNLGGWEKEMHYYQFIDGESGEPYFKSEPYSYQFEEHSISKDTSHPLAATSCFYKYRFQINEEENTVVIDRLIGSCLPDLEEGVYFFQNNKWELRKD